jgi:hypothetical protein
MAVDLGIVDAMLPPELVCVTTDEVWLDSCEERHQCQWDFDFTGPTEDISSRYRLGCSGHNAVEIWSMSGSLDLEVDPLAVQLVIEVQFVNTEGNFSPELSFEGAARVLVRGGRDTPDCGYRVWEIDRDDSQLVGSDGHLSISIEDAGVGNMESISLIRVKSCRPAG